MTIYWTKRKKHQQPSINKIYYKKPRYPWGDWDGKILNLLGLTESNVQVWNDAFFNHHHISSVHDILSLSPTRTSEIISHAESRRQSTDVSAAFRTDQEPNQGPLGLKIQGVPLHQHIHDKTGDFRDINISSWTARRRQLRRAGAP